MNLLLGKEPIPLAVFVNGIMYLNSYIIEVVYLYKKYIHQYEPNISY